MRDPSLDDPRPHVVLSPSASTPPAVPAPDPRDRLAVLLTAAVCAPAAGSSTARREHDDAVREAVCAIVRRLKDEGLPPERVLVAVKAYVHRAVGPHSEGDHARDLRARIVAWCIAAYYRAD